MCISTSLDDLQQLYNGTMILYSFAELVDNGRQQE